LNRLVPGGNLGFHLQLHSFTTIVLEPANPFADEIELQDVFGSWCIGRRLICIHVPTGQQIVAFWGEEKFLLFALYGFFIA
jgi:hypothetical protein